MIKLIRRAAQYLGRRGGAMLLLGFIFSCYGFSALVDPVHDQGHYSLYALLPPGVRVVLWAGSSLVAAATLIRHDRRDFVAFAILSVPPMFLLVSHLISYAAFLAGLTTYDAGLLRALQWIGILGLSTLIASWPEVSADASPTLPQEGLPEMRTQTALIFEERPSGTGGPDAAPR